MNIASAFQGLVGLLWIVAIVLIVFVVARIARNQPVRNSSAILLITILLAVTISSVGSGLTFINPEERGVVISAVSGSGYRSEILQPGLHWIIPFFETAVTYPISRQSYTMSISPDEGANKGDDSISARTADGQELLIDASVIYSINPARIIDIHINWKNRYEDGLVRAQARGVIRDAVSQYRVDEANSTKRLEMTESIRKRLVEKFDENGLVMVDFILRNIAFSKEYAQSVEQKQIAEQQAQQARFVVEQKKQEAEQARQVAQGQADAAVIKAKSDAESTLIRAKAEAEALQIRGKILKDYPEMIQLEAIQKLNPEMQVMMIPYGSNFLLPLPTATPKP